LGGDVFVKIVLPKAITAVAAAMVLASIFFGLWSDLAREIDKWFVLSGAVAACVGLVNLTRVHLRNISRRGTNWDTSVLMMVSCYAMLILGLLTSPVDVRYNWIFQATVVPLSATFLALLGFYITSAAYRAFRIRTVDASVLLVVALIVLMGRAPIGAMLWGQFEPLTRWIMDIPNTSAMRAVVICTVFGAIMTALRIAAGTERSYLGGE
jgi:hypothetical protein